MKVLLLFAGAVGATLPHFWSAIVLILAVFMLASGHRNLPRIYPAAFVLPLAFALLRFFENIRSNSTFAWSEFFYLLFVALALLIMASNIKAAEIVYLLLGISLGSWLLLAALSINFYDQIYRLKPWNAYPQDVAKLEQNTFKAQSDNAILSRDIGYLGSGTIKVTLPLRLRETASDTFILKLPASLVKQESPSKPAAICEVSVEWSLCEFTAELAKRDKLQLWLGGWNAWRAEEPFVLVVGALRISYLTQFPIREVILLNGRASGLTFNPNALGISALGAFLATFLLFRGLTSNLILFVLPHLAILLLTGSRTAFAGLLVFLVMLFLGPRPHLRVVALLMPLTLIFALWLGFVLNPQGLSGLPRILNPFAELLQESRVNIYSEVFSNLGFSLLGQGDVVSFLQKLHNKNSSVPQEHAHSLWLQAYIVSGAFGVGLLFWVMLRVESSLTKLRDPAPWAAFVTLYFVSFFDYFAFYPPYYILLFGLGFLPYYKVLYSTFYEKSHT